MPRDIYSFLEKLPSKTTVLDLGANIGVATKFFRSFDFEVVAIEPNPVASKAFSRRFQSDSSVSLHIAAVSSSTRQNVPLYLHRESRQNPLKWSVASSLMRQKPNVDVNSSIPVSQIDIIEVLSEIDGSPVIKMDIEGAEIEVLNHLIETKSIDVVDVLYVEFHSQYLSDAEEERVMEMENELTSSLKSLDSLRFRTWH